MLTLVDPRAQARMVRALIDVYRHEGKLPDCRMSLCKGFTQGGSNADNVLADSYLKGLGDGIDWETGYEAVVSDAEGECVWGKCPSFAALDVVAHGLLQMSLPFGQWKEGVDCIAGKHWATFLPTTLIRTVSAFLRGPFPGPSSIRTMISASRKWPET